MCSDEEETVAPNHSSHVGDSDQSGTAFITVGKTIMKLYKFIKKRRNIYQNIRGKIRSIGLAYSKVQDESGVKAASEKMSRAYTKEENSEKRSREHLNESKAQLSKRCST